MIEPQRRNILREAAILAIFIEVGPGMGSPFLLIQNAVMAAANVLKSAISNCGKW